MSATNRTLGVREQHDFYETPEWLTRAFLPALWPSIRSNPRVLEPACGLGAISRIVTEEWRVAVDEMDLIDYGTGAEVGDFLTADLSGLEYDLVITNPPYRLAQEFVMKALTLAPVVAMLLRVNFLGGQKRAAWLRQHTPAIFVTPRRPPFSLNKHGKPGTDATEYAWFVWGIEPRIVILDTETERYKV